MSELERMRIALAESVKLQSHYARLLNDYDGGLRRQFSSPEEWIERLIEMRKIEYDLVEDAATKDDRNDAIGRAPQFFEGSIKPE